MARRSRKDGRGDAIAFERRRSVRDRRRRFVLFCEGRNTEPGYFRAIRRFCAGGAVAIRIVLGLGVPMAVAERAADERRQLRARGADRGGDRVWAVFDRDSHPEYEEAAALCERYGVEVARSDPCFELWLILHIEEYDKACGNSDVQRRLETLRPEYNRKGAKTADFTGLIRRVENAEERAAAQLRLREREGNPFGNPSTTVGNLTRAIREANGQARWSAPPAR